MANKILSSKRLQIDKDKANMVVILAVAAFVAVFSLVACKAILGQRSYQSRVITEKKKALDQLKKNNEAASQLVASYKSFVASPENIIGGTFTGTGDSDGDNAKIILDALPSKYDFPALITSVDKLFSSRNYSIGTLSGTDDELSQSQSTNSEATPVQMPYDVTLTGNLDVAQGIVDVLQQSIRPMKIINITFSGSDSELNININAVTYYQPQKTIKITKQVIK